MSVAVDLSKLTVAELERTAREARLLLDAAGVPLELDQAPQPRLEDLHALAKLLDLQVAYEPAPPVVALGIPKDTPGNVRCVISIGLQNRRPDESIAAYVAGTLASFHVGGSPGESYAADILRHIGATFCRRAAIANGFCGDTDSSQDCRDAENLLRWKDPGAPAT